MPTANPTSPTANDPTSMGRIGAIHEVAVMRALPGLGDFLCATPALRALRAGLPGARITLIGLPTTRELVARYGHLVDDFLEFPGYWGLPETPVDEAALREFLLEVHGRFDLALQMHGDGRFSNRFVRSLGARTMAGFHPSSRKCPDRRTFAPWPSELPEPLVWLSLLSRLGVPACGEQLEFPIFPADVIEGEGLLIDAGVPPDSSIAVVHVGSSQPSRRLEPAVLAVVVEGLAARGHAVVLTGGAGETAFARAVRTRADCRTFDMAGRTSLGALAALFRRAQVVVTNDTGTSHLASALRTPSVVVFLASDVRRWAPLDRKRHRVIDATRTAISPTRILDEALTANGGPS